MSGPLKIFLISFLRFVNNARSDRLISCTAPRYFQTIQRELFLGVGLEIINVDHGAREVVGVGIYPAFGRFELDHLSPNYALKCFVVFLEVYLALESFSEYSPKVPVYVAATC